MILFYDFEVFRRDWLVVIVEPVTKTETVIINDRDRLREFYEAHKKFIWIGYNAKNYDQYILKGILADFNPYEITEHIIQKGLPGWGFSDLLGQFPVITYDVHTGYNSLKQLEAFMGDSIVETSVPFDIERKLTESEISETVGYCRNDVEATVKVFLQRKSEFDSHMALIKTFNLPLKYISKTQSQLASIILGAVPVETCDEWEIRIPETLALTKYQHVADWFLDSKNHTEESFLKTEVSGVPHVFAWGGLHGAVQKFHYRCSEDESLILADVNQLYPSIMVRYRLLSRAVKKPERFEEILATSLRLKKEHKKAEREPYKRICNIVYGAEGDQHNAMYDPLNRKLVCVYGQLLLLDLIEKLESAGQLIQSNTDGVLYLIKQQNRDKVNSIIGEWETRTGLKMSIDEYSEVWQGDVNCYILKSEAGQIKSKGGYVKSLSALDNDLPIVNLAIKDYLTKGINPAVTVNGCND